MTQATTVERPRLTLAGAKAILAAAEAEARKNNWPVAIAVVDDGGHLYAFERLDDTQLGSIKVAIGKARSAVLFKRESKAWEEALKSGRLSPLAFPDLLPAEGGIPLVVAGQIIGGVGVSGVKPEDDARVARAGAAALG